MTDATQTLNEALRLALAEDRVGLLRLMYEMPMADLERLVEAAQLIDSEGVDVLDSEYFYGSQDATYRSTTA